VAIKKDILGKDLEVALQIYDISNVKKEPVYFSKLVKILDGRVSRNRISQALDRLFDDGILTAEFKKVNKKWARVYDVSGEAEGFIESIYDQVIED
jgi:DNA-binding transcriptional ArsR family regulator